MTDPARIRQAEPEERHWFYFSQPDAPGWYAVLCGYDVCEGYWPNVAYWDGTEWQSISPVVAYWPEAVGSESEACEVARRRAGE